MSAEKGFVYIMMNGAMPGLLKIGASTKHPLNRARELSAPTASAVPFVVAYHRYVADPFQVEAALHRLLDRYRANDSREFFRIELHKVVELLERYEEGRDLFYGDDVRTPFAELFNTFPDDGSARSLNEDEQFKCRQLEHKLGHHRS